MSDSATLPTGYRVRLGAGTHRCSDGTTLFGGAGTIVRLRPLAARHLGTNGEVAVDSAESALLARLLLDRGLAEPCWASSPAHDISDITVVIPVKDRIAELGRLLESLPTLPVVVVDDGSKGADAVAEVCREHGATVVRHAKSRGPSAARNTGLRHARTTFVAFVDSDVVLSSGALSALRRHFEDPKVGLVAPRILSLVASGTSLHSYEAAHSSLDLGPTPALVAPHARVSYVPSAMMLARVEALGDGFDESMHVAEDVDLVWRMHRSWSVRYEPGVTVQHDHRTEFGAWFGRKSLYGSGAAALATRHGRAVAPAVLTPWTTAVTIAVLAARRWSPLVIVVAGLAAHHSLARRLSFSENPRRAAAALIWMGLRSTIEQTGSAVTRHYVPITVALLPFSRRARIAYTCAVVARGITDHRRTESALNPLQHSVLHAADDLAYGIGLWRGALRERSVGALLPLVRTGNTAAQPKLRRALRRINAALHNHIALRSVAIGVQTPTPNERKP